jgi:hypothetical protein
MGRRVLLLMLCALLGGAPEAFAQVSRWQDEQGRIHFTDDPGKVPPRFRTQAEQLDLPEPAYAPDQQSAPAADRQMTQAFAEALKERWPDLPASKRQQLAGTILDRLLLLLVAIAIHTLATLAMFGHAVANRRMLWAAGNLLVPFVPPLYALVGLEADALKKGLIVVAWATGPAAAIALQWAIAGIVA